ncbi:sensor domain-containing diguanylate cyclase [Stutzerimonas stutzeri]|nr:sensor domain-containing diguanylate cyclase [Stutzerimonas stutzeri]
MLTRRRRSFAGFILLSLLLVGVSAQLLFLSEIQRWDARFAQQVQDVSAVIRHQLDTNEAVLAGFSAFLQAVDQSDEAAAARYAEAVVTAYPQVYMLEVARGVPLAEQYAFEELLRLSWRADFRLKEFPSPTRQPAHVQLPLSETWPVLFMYPQLVQASTIYGVRLETVGHLSHALARSRQTRRPVASPTFALYEGGNAYILLQSVSRPESPRPGAGPNFFGSSMVALLLMKTDALQQAVLAMDVDRQLRIEAFLDSDVGAPSQLLSTEPAPASPLDRLLLPRLTERVEIGSRSQPTTLILERQLRMGDVLTRETLTVLLILIAVLALLPAVLLRHYRTSAMVEREYQRSSYLATHDALTRLPNRQLLADRFAEAYAFMQRHGTPFAVMVVDLDRFKETNDRFGHKVGDQVLIAVTEHMRQAIRVYDTAARYGGDEFVVLVRDIPSAVDAEAAGRKLLQAISMPIETDAGEQRVSCSIGIALCPDDGESLDELLAAADRAMYRVKQQGRENVALVDSEA